MRYWCPKCGIVRDVPRLRLRGRNIAPICKHNAGLTLAHPPASMEPLPRYHPAAAP